MPGSSGIVPVLQKSQKFRVRVRKCYRIHASSGYCGTGVQISQKFRAGFKMLYPYPAYLWHGRTELTEVPGTGMNVVQHLKEVPGTGMNVLQNLQRFFVG